MQAQQQQAPPEPLDMNKFLPQLNQTLANMKRMNAQQLGIMVQTQSEQIGRQHDTLIQEIAPLIQEVGRLLQENKRLLTQIPKTKEEVPIPDAMRSRDPPKKETPTLNTKVETKGK